MAQSQSMMDNTETFIQHYHDHPCLWQVTNAQYRDRFARDNALRDIAHNLGISSNEVKEKIKRLRTQYSAERRKYLKRKPTGSAADDSKTSKWRWYNSLEFLSDGLVHRSSHSNLDVV